MNARHRREERLALYCVEIRTERWAHLVEWYREVLGMRVLVRVIDDGYALLDAGETRIALVSRSETDGPSRRISLAFEVSDLPAVCARLVAAGTRVTYPDRHPEGLREATTADPDGNRIRLFAWPHRH